MSLIKKQDDSCNIMFNRIYKLLESKTSNRIQPINISDWLNRIDLTARRLYCSKCEDAGVIYLYHDGCNPVNGKSNMRTYLEKLALLAKLQHE